MKTEDYKSESATIAGMSVTIVSYKIGDKFYCHIENKDPGATIARSEGSSAEEAIAAATAKVQSRQE